MSTKIQKAILVFVGSLIVFLPVAQTASALDIQSAGEVLDATTERTSPTPSAAVVPSPEENDFKVYSAGSVQRIADRKKKSKIKLTSAQITSIKQKCAPSQKKILAVLKKSQTDMKVVETLTTLKVNVENVWKFSRNTSVTQTAVDAVFADISQLEKLTADLKKKQESLAFALYDTSVISCVELPADFSLALTESRALMKDVKSSRAAMKEYLTASLKKNLQAFRVEQ
jgi:hypothetical protein